MKKTIVLDHGYVEPIEHWGSDEAIVEAARMSTGKGFLGWGPTCEECGFTKGDDHEVGCSQPEKWKAGDEKLLRYLWENKHSTPFEMAGLTIEVQAPIMVFREWHRHRVPFGYSEASARYGALPNVNYMPTTDRCLISSTINKQAGSMKGADVLTLESALEWLAELADVYEHAERVYQSGLTRGVPKELARLPMPVGRYSKMRATGNLRGWLTGFLALRKASTAQWEIRAYADVVGDILGERFPRSWSLFMEGFRG